MKKPEELEVLLCVLGIKTHQNLSPFDRLARSTAELERDGESAICVPRKRIELHRNPSFANGLVRASEPSEQERIPLVGDDVVWIGCDRAAKVGFGRSVGIS